MTQLSASTSSRLTPTRPVSVLVAEDDAEIRDLLTQALEAAGFRVSPVRDGFAALNEARRAAPNVIVLDLGLPLLDGQEFLHAWRTVESSPHARVLVLSASSELPAPLASGGVAGHITKPFDVDAVIEAVSRLSMQDGGA